MARKASRRTNYTNDAIAMKRLAEGVALDTETTEEWRGELQTVLLRAMTLFLERDRYVAKPNAA
jgi:hypothetical protein